MKKTIIFSLLLLAVQLLNAQNDVLWLTTTSGGPNGYGTIIMGDTVARNFQVNFSFNQNNGSYPCGNMVVGSNGKLYANTLRGGLHDSCVLYSFDQIGWTCHTEYDYMINMLFGAIPYSGMAAYPDGKLYGTTNAGGTNSGGVIYTYDPVGGYYQVVYNFVDSTGSGPYAELLLASNGKFYGMATGGHSGNLGVIFSFDPSSNHYSPVHYFNYATGTNPAYADLIQATNGKIYGVVHSEGAHQGGVLFSLDPSTNAYTDLYDFPPTAYGTPWGGLVQAKDGKLYGTTSSISTIPVTYGVLYSYNIATDSLKVLFHLDSLTGYDCQRSMTEIAEHKLIGGAKEGGLHGMGTFFTYDYVADTFSKAMDLDSIHTGAHPSCRILATHATVPFTAMVTGRDTICDGQTTQLIVHTTGSTGTVHYQWSPATGLNCTTCDTVIANPAVTQSYTVVVSDSLNSDTILLSVAASPTVNIDVLVYPNDDTTYYTNLDTSIYIPHSFCPFIFAKQPGVPPQYFVAHGINAGSNPLYYWVVGSSTIGNHSDTLFMQDVFDTMQAHNYTYPILISCTMYTSLTGCLPTTVAHSIYDTLTINGCPSGIDNKYINNNISLSPNPNNGQFTLSISQPVQQLKIELINVAGQVLYTEQLKDQPSLKKEFNFNDLAKGIYLLKVNTENSVVVKRVVVQ